MKKILLLDLDNTLFRSSELRVEIYKRIAKFLSSENKSSEGVIEICNAIGKRMIIDLGYFSPDIFIQELSKEIDIIGKEKKVKDLILDTEFSKGFMYTDVQDVLASLSGKVDLGIFSQGEEDFQKSKLHSMLHFFPSQSIHFEKDKKKELERIFNTYKDFKIYYVDDRIHILEHAKKVDSGVFTVWIQRGEYANREKAQDFQPDAIIHSLMEIVPILGK